MSENTGFYQVHSYGDRLKPGDSLKIEHTLSFIREQADISALVPLPISELERRRADSVNIEKVIFDQLRAAVSKWEEQAALTLLLDKAIDYVRVPVKPVY